MLQEAVNDRENGLLEKIIQLEAELADFKEVKKRLEKEAVEKIRQGKTVDSKAIVDLKQAKERINELEYQIIELEQNRDDFRN
ncbi:4166_t:CDS:1, partial [Paraglomus occultum]